MRLLKEGSALVDALQFSPGSENANAISSKLIPNHIVVDSWENLI